MVDWLLLLEVLLPLLSLPWQREQSSMSQGVLLKKDNGQIKLPGLAQTSPGQTLLQLMPCTKVSMLERGTSGHQARCAPKPLAAMLTSMHQRTADMFFIF